MSEVLQRLVDLLALERLDDGLFRGESQDLGFGHLFGGQVLGQALAAAQETVPSGRDVHSFHSYFLRAGDLALPVIYDVENLRDGGSFSARRVSAIQHGRPIFFMTASFQAPEPGLEHQIAMPKAHGPEGFLSQHELAQRMRDKLPPAMVERYLDNLAIELRVVEDPRTALEDRSPKRQVWMRANGELPDDPQVHRYLLAYASDFNFLTTACKPHGLSLFTPGLKLATIDHAMWYHRPFRFDQWLMFDIDCPTTMNSRGLVRGQIFDQQGNLVASAQQEGLLRQRKRQG
ncbi:acyl-CoA thioesterase II [Ferrimonas marina]|uniref:Acyl-CoA thioesterase 2 n=1 Tax=Ferrimonas marina TaxID=299255 RepID=A0A1M5VMF6_9GAMM|nr:acyl-CoA thioesterase II [Ferrimonas marina]SHH76431.1 acyl-CoA thioesterase-2 [Ferrimonas marina]